MSRPYRFGVIAGGRATSGADWVERVRRAEALGYATWLNVDHVSVDPAPLTALAIAAAATTTLRVGSFVFCNDLRHPVLLAQELATLDLLSEGRLELGLGPGYAEADYTQTGIARDSAGTRIARFAEALQIITRLFTEEVVSFAGHHYVINDARGAPKPVQQPHPPIYVGGGGQRMLTLAARHADIVGVTPINTSRGIDPTDATPEATARKISWIREAAGDRFDRLELSCPLYGVSIGEVRSEGEAGSPARRWGPAMPPDSPHLIAGSVDGVVDAIQDRRERYGFSYFQVMEQDMEAFAPVVARLAVQS